MNEINICEGCGASLPTSTMQVCEQCRSVNTQHAHTAKPASVQLDPAKWRTEWCTNMHGECYPVLLIEGPDDIHRRLDFAEDEMPLLKLIQAAPDLLAACQRAWEDQPRCLRDRVGASRLDDCRCVSCALRAAIDKATGRTS